MMWLSELCRWSSEHPGTVLLLLFVLGLTIWAWTLPSTDESDDEENHGDFAV